MTLKIVRLWKSKNDSHLFIFTGPVDAKVAVLLRKIETGVKLTKTETVLFVNTFNGKIDYPILSSKVNFIDKLLNNEDNMNIITKKLVVYMESYVKTTPEKIYLWTYRNVKKNDAVILNFIQHCFKNNASIRFSEFKTYVKNYFNVSINDDLNEIDQYMAYNLCKELDYNTIIEPLLFSYTYDGFFEYVEYDPFKIEVIKEGAFNIQSNLALILGSFELLDNDIIEMVTLDYISSSYHDLFFPYKQSATNYTSIAQFIELLDTKTTRFHNHEYTYSYNSESYITYMQIRGNDYSYNKKVNLSNIFEQIHVNDNIPFIKYKSSSNVFYKINKRSLVTSLTHANLKNWTKYKPMYGKLINMTYIVFKMLIGKMSFCTVTLSDTLSYDIRFNINSKEKMSIDYIHQFYDVINKLLGKIRNINRDSLLLNVTKDSVKLVTLVSSNVLRMNTSTIGYENIHNIITAELFPFFNLVETNDKNVLVLQYKNVDNYTKYDNIQAFLNLYHNLPKEELKNKLMATFPMDENTAEMEYSKWKNVRVEMIEEESKAFNKYTSFSNFVSIKLKLHNVLEARYEIAGAKTYESIKLLSSLVQYLIDLANQKKQLSLPIADPILFDQELFEVHVVPSNKTSPAKSSEKGNSSPEKHHDDLKFLLDDLDDIEDIEGNDNFDDKEDQEDLKTQEKNKDQKLDVNLKGSISKPIKDKGMYFLNMLKTADPDLFNTMSYARTCQHTDMRQPIVLSPYEKKKIDDDYPGAYDSYVQTGSTEELASKNIYICPKVWCPRSRVAMTYEQYQGKKCPFSEEEPIFFDKEYWGKDTKTALTKSHHVGFLKENTHNQGFCMPCCFIKQVKKKPKCNQNLSEQKEIKQESVEGNEKYIVGEKNYPLDNARYGLAPSELLESIDGDKCGRNDSRKNLIESGKICYLRRGINHGKHSFLSCVLSVIDSNLTVNAFLKMLQRTITLEKFIGLENGKMIKMFINQSFDINNVDHFREFVSWFLSPKQNKYRLKYNLLKIELDLKRGMQGGADEPPKKKVVRKIVQSEEHLLKKKIISKLKELTKNKQQHDVPSKKKIVRKLKDVEDVKEQAGAPSKKRIAKKDNEFKEKEPIPFEPLNLKSYPTYKDIIREFLIYNGYKHFIELLSSDNEIKNHINMLDVINTLPSISRHFIIIDQSNVMCPVNRPYDNVNNPFVLIIKNGAYYEPLCKAQLKDKTIDYNFEFNYNSLSKPVKRLIDFYLNNCGGGGKKTNIVLLLESLSFKVRAYVLDFGFRVTGVLLENNLFIPLKEKLDTYDVLKNSFIYYNDLVDFKCTETKEAIQDIFKKINYELADFIYHGDKLVACIIRFETREVVVPLQLNKKSTFYRAIEDDLDIFIQHQEVDRRVRTIQTLEQEDTTYEKASTILMKEIYKDSNLRSEIRFLSSKDNPFPKDYRREKILNILKGVSKSVKDDIMYKLTEALIIGSPLRGSSKIYNTLNNEVIIDQTEVNNNKIKELIETQSNPYKILTDTLNYSIDKFIRSDRETVDAQTLLKTKFYNNNTLAKAPDRLDREYKMKAFQRIVSTNYTPTFIYSLFATLYTGLTNMECSIDMLKSIVRTRFISDFRKNVIQYNPSMEHLKKQISKQDQSLDSYLKIFDSINYFPSFYEVKVLTNLIGINTVVIFRKTREKEIVYYYNDSPWTLVLHKDYNSTMKRDVFDIYVKNERLLFKKVDLPVEFLNIIKDNLEA